MDFSKYLSNIVENKISKVHEFYNSEYQPSITQNLMK